jgi:hypothetical protein
MDLRAPQPDFLVPDAKPFDFLLLSLVVVSMSFIGIFFYVW